ncbi:MAG: hypothetical protein JSW67_08860 [Candidatus Latescibacterota bacterium]|nr:MAG: hypothetical protein JSW67_08860 [Candidatus Latescibacterota bacterium]
MERVRALIGREKALREVSQALHFGARRVAAAGVGAMHVTCADESEHECVEAFQHGFVHYLLPALKFARQSAFRIANLGGRYEWGSVRIAEDHFATPPTKDAGKLLVVKINAHVAFEEEPAPVVRSGGPAERSYRFGFWKRYDSESACCGALAELLGGSTAPFVEELRESFHSEGRDRVAMLRDTTRVDPTLRALHAAIVSARLQARKATLDIQDYEPVSPTLYFVLPCVTINRHERDTEILCGIYSLDSRGGNAEGTYVGLGDDPSAYETWRQNGLFVVSDGEAAVERRARDHRALVRDAWKEQRIGTRSVVRDERIERIQRDVEQNKHHHHHHAKKLLRAALPILAEVAPVPAAILLFAEGAVGIHHAFRVQQLAREMEKSQEARQILDEIEAKVDHLEPDHARALIELLMQEYAR